MESKEIEENVSRWIYHFEKQAKIGISSRSSFNNRIIIVQKLKKDKSQDNSSNKINLEEEKKKIPDIISPIQQVVDQAEEEIRREEPHNRDKIALNNNQNKVSVKRKRTVKGRISTKKFKDIFS
jgi:hypothetical protein